MTTDFTLIIAMSSFIMSMCISPGPVNLVILSSGISNGVIKTLPFVFGAATSFTVLMFVLGLGVGQLVQQYPTAMEYMGYAGSGYILYLAYKIVTAPVEIDFENVKSHGFIDGAIMQSLNPKAWVAALAGITALIPQGEFQILLLFVF